MGGEGLCTILPSASEVGKVGRKKKGIPIEKLVMEGRNLELKRATSRACMRRLRARRAKEALAMGKKKGTIKEKSARGGVYSDNT
jgi:hypothetical protein